MMYFSNLQTGSKYRISYTNAEGECSERDITVHRRWSSYGHDYIKAYCERAGEERTFRLDRIESAVDMGATEDYEHDAFMQRFYCELEAQHRAYRKEQEAPKISSAGAERKSRGAGHPFLVFLSAAFVVFVIFAGFTDNKGSSYTAKKTAAAPERIKPMPVKTPEWERDILLRKDRYAVTTGFRDERLLEIYASADTDYDNILSWQEISWFQNKIKNRFSYRSNNTALNPLDFLSADGGDCEDWSIFTCGMLRFWGYTAYVGVIDGGSNTGASLHAIALFYKKTPPANRSYSYYQLDAPYSFYEVTLPAGCYLPIDYNHTGSFSNASRPDSPLHYVYRPEEIYDRYM